MEPVMSFSDFNFTNLNGDGAIKFNNSNNIISDWITDKVIYMEFYEPRYVFDDIKTLGFRYVRSAE